MQYNKGDIIKFGNGTVALVLNSGMKGPDFAIQYYGQVIRMVGVSEVLSFKVSFSSAVCRHENGREYVWYNVLIGDENSWITDAMLCYRIKGEYSPIKDNDAV